MIDFIHLELNNPDVNVFKNHKDFKDKFEEITSKRKSSHCVQSEYKEITCKIINDRYVHLEGSFHKHFHNKNTHDFTYLEFVHVINRLSVRYKTNLLNSKIKSFEFGVNLKLSFSPIPLIMSILSYQSSPFEFEDFKGKGFSKRCFLQRFDIKIYDKGFQNNLDYHVLRFEIKVKKMIHVQNQGIEILADLTNEKKLIGLHKLLINTLSGILFKNDTFHSLNSRDHKIIEEVYSKSGQLNKMDSSQKKHMKYLRREYKDLIRTKSNLNIIPILQSKITIKWFLLLSYQNMNLHKFSPDLSLLIKNENILLNLQAYNRLNQVINSNEYYDSNKYKYMEEKEFYKAYNIIVDGDWEKAMNDHDEFCLSTFYIYNNLIKHSLNESISNKVKRKTFNYYRIELHKKLRSYGYQSPDQIISNGVLFKIMKDGKVNWLSILIKNGDTLIHNFSNFDNREQLNEVYELVMSIPYTENKRQSIKPSIKQMKLNRKWRQNL